MNKNIPIFVVAIIVVALAFLRLPEDIRAVDIVSLLGAGIFIGVALVTSFNSLRVKD